MIKRVTDIKKPLRDMSADELQEIREAMNYQVFLAGASSAEIAWFQQELIASTIRLVREKEVDTEDK